MANKGKANKGHFCGNIPIFYGGQGCLLICYLPSSVKSVSSGVFESGIDFSPGCRGLQAAQAAGEVRFMSLTRNFKETVQARMERDPAFREELLKAGVDCLLCW